MSTTYIVLAAIFAVGLALGLYAWLAPRKPEPVPSASQPAASPEPPQTGTGWTSQAGDEFSGLTESARCDLIFAVSDLEDERSEQMLLHALNDPSDPVAIAAAHALARRGRTQAVNSYAQEHPGERAERIVQTLALLE